MSDAAKRVRGSDRLRHRFAASYRGTSHPDDALDWLIDPDAASRRGTPPPAARIDRASLYRPGASGQEARAVARALHAIEQDAREAERVVSSIVRSSTDRHRRRVAATLVAVAGIASVAVGRVIAVDRAAHDESAALERSIVMSRGALAPELLFARYPDRADAAWRQASPVSATALDGATPVAVPIDASSSRVLLVVSCSAADRSYEWTVSRGATTGPRHGYGACGSLHPVDIGRPAGTGLIRILVVTRGIDPFSISVSP